MRPRGNPRGICVAPKNKDKDLASGCIARSERELSEVEVVLEEVELQLHPGPSVLLCTRGHSGNNCKLPHPEGMTYLDICKEDIFRNSGIFNLPGKRFLRFSYQYLNRNKNSICCSEFQLIAAMATETETTNEGAGDGKGAAPVQLEEPAADVGDAAAADLDMDTAAATVASAEAAGHQPTPPAQDDSFAAPAASTGEVGVEPAVSGMFTEVA